MRIDLHVHTTASDGMLTPSQVVDAVRRVDLQVFGVADHDTVDGLAEAGRAAEAAGLTLVPAVELSAYWGKVEFHILGYFLDPACPALQDFLRTTRDARHARLHAMLSRLHAMGMSVPAENVILRATNGNVGRPHLARALVERGFVASTDEAFNRYLGTDKPAYVPRPDVSVEDAIRIIREAGGLASLAHPGLHNRDDAIPDLVKAGLDAIEAYHPKHGVGRAAHYRRLARRYGLLITGGSDYHGEAAGDHATSPGMPCLPEEYYVQLRDAWERRRPAGGQTGTTAGEQGGGPAGESDGNQLSGRDV